MITSLMKYLSPSGLMGRGLAYGTHMIAKKYIDNKNNIKKGEMNHVQQKQSKQ